jgi:thioesterase domain-containing protein
LICLQPDGDLDPLFLVHAATGMATGYVELSRHLENQRPVYGIQSPALGGRGRPLETVEAMAREYISAIRTVQPTGPYLLGGWSFGGLVGFEMARQLSHQRERVRMLALIDTILPEVMPAVPYEDVPLLVAFAAHYGMTVSLEFLSGVPPAERLSHVNKLAKAAGILAQNASEAELENRYRVFVTNVMAAANYSPQHYTGRMTLIRAAEPLTESLAALARRDPSLGWSRYAAVPPEIHFVAGNHMTVMSQSNVHFLAAVLRADLEKTDRASARFEQA